jgi:STE24 endopeptidase
VPPIFLAITVLFIFVSPYLLAFGVDPPEDPQLRREARVLAERVGAEGTPVDVEEVSDLTTQPNAFAAGVGPTERIVLFDTLLDGRFEDGEVEVVVAHEFGHIAENHISKGLGWSVLLAFPIAFLIAEATRRRGGLGNPAVLPYGALVLVVLNLAVAPFTNQVSRRYEAEADWVALQATRDVEGAQGLFAGFGKEGLHHPEPPGWWHLFFGSHPTLMERIEMAEAFERR